MLEKRRQAARVGAAIETHIHLASDHVAAALAAGFQLAEMREQVIDDRWIATKASWAAHRDVPISFAFVWRGR